MARIESQSGSPPIPFFIAILLRIRFSNSRSLPILFQALWCLSGGPGAISVSKATETTNSHSYSGRSDEVQAMVVLYPVGGGPLQDHVGRDRDPADHLAPSV